MPRTGEQAAPIPQTGPVPLTGPIPRSRTATFFGADGSGRVFLRRWGFPLFVVFVAFLGRKVIMPFVFAGLRTAMLTAFLLIVASELIAANEGLGYLIIFAQRTFNPTLMFAGVLTVSTMGFIADRLLQALGRRLFRWQEQAGR